MKVHRKNLSEIELRALEKRRLAIRMMLVRALRYFLICFSITGGLYICLFSSTFRVQKVNFFGLDDQQYPVFVDRAALDNINSRFQSKNYSLILLDTDKMQKEVQNVQGVKSVVVMKRWPHEVAVVIEPRKPICRIGNKLADKDGELLRDVAPNMPAYPEVVASNEAKQDVLLLLDAISSEKLDIKAVTANTRDDITVVQNSGFTIVFGSTKQLTLKLADIKQILGSELTAGKTVLDVSAPKSPIVR
ncbi:MAG: cell division protein FtsQ/DivIB [Candidatus Ancillula trichonymphae]|jgi:cell division septal protein FtsQ|nr:cell division protein FtsQ/DivIB [Candidatus Ancillula trichonymphae]